MKFPFLTLNKFEVKKYVLKKVFFSFYCEYFICDADIIFLKEGSRKSLSCENINFHGLCFHVKLLYFIKFFRKSRLFINFLFSSVTYRMPTAVFYLKVLAIYNIKLIFNISLQNKTISYSFKFQLFLFLSCYITSKPASSKIKIVYICLTEPYGRYIFSCDENASISTLHMLHIYSCIINGYFRSYSLIWYVNAGIRLRLTKCYLLRWNFFLFCTMLACWYSAYIYNIHIFLLQFSEFQLHSLI